MSTDQDYDTLFDRKNLYPMFCGTENDEIEWILSKALKQAREDFTEIYIYKRHRMYWMTNCGVSVTERVARIYPGGRIEYNPKVGKMPWKGD